MRRNHVARMKHMRSAYKILVRNREVNKSYGRPRRAWISEFWGRELD